jgi:hypothetical protein
MFVLECANLARSETHWNCFVVGARFTCQTSRIFGLCRPLLVPCFQEFLLLSCHWDCASLTARTKQPCREQRPNWLPLLVRHGLAQSKSIPNTSRRHSILRNGLMGVRYCTPSNSPSIGDEHSYERETVVEFTIRFFPKIGSRIETTASFSSLVLPSYFSRLG